MYLQYIQSKDKVYFLSLLFLYIFVFIVKQQDSRAPTRCEAWWKGGVFIVKQQGSRVPTRCEAWWKGGVLIILFFYSQIIILLFPFFSTKKVPMIAHRHFCHQSEQIAFRYPFCFIFLLVKVYLLCLIFACAAASLAIGTLKGEHDTQSIPTEFKNSIVSGSPPCSPQIPT